MSLHHFVGSLRLLRAAVAVLLASGCPSADSPSAARSEPPIKVPKVSPGRLAFVDVYRDGGVLQDGAVRTSVTFPSHGTRRIEVFERGVLVVRRDEGADSTEEIQDRNGDGQIDATQSLRLIRGHHTQIVTRDEDFDGHMDRRETTIFMTESHRVIEEELLPDGGTRTMIDEVRSSEVE